MTSKAQSDSQPASLSEAGPGAVGGTALATAPVVADATAHRGALSSRIKGPLTFKGPMDTLLKPYAQVLFGDSRWGAIVAVLATFVTPTHGLLGLLCVALTVGWARLLGRTAEEIKATAYGVNGLLVGLALGVYYPLSGALVILTVLITLLTAILTAVLTGRAARGVGVPILSLPFVLATWAALLAARRLSALELKALDVTTPLLHWPGLFEGHDVISIYVKAMGACFFQVEALSGLLVVVALLLISRWSFLLSILGFATGWLTYDILGGAPGDLTTQMIGFNFILAAIATGGVYTLLSPASLGLAAVSGALAAMLSAAVLSMLAPIGLPPLALPFILATQLLVFALITAVALGPLRRTQGVPSTPERNLTRAQAKARRYPDPALPLVQLPVMGRWRVSQGHHGPHTHQGLWAHAWDFEVVDHPTFNAPVVAPMAGQVVKVVDSVEDNPIGEVNTAQNWGNLVILWHHGQVYSALCHLKQGSITVTEGQYVTRGQTIGKVGNSGRSPVPHLHLQLQSRPEVGAPTLYGELLHYVVEAEDGAPRYETYGVPEEGCVLSALQVSAEVREALTLAPDLTFHWAISGPGLSPREERWRSIIDPLGARRLEQVEGEAVLATAGFFADEQYLTFLDYDGDGDALLGWLSLGCPRVPYTAQRDLTWSDRPEASPWMGLPGRLAHELMMPFADVGGVHTSSRSSTRMGEVVVTTTLQWPRGVAKSGRRPDEIEVVWTTGQGPTAITLRRDGAVVLEGVRRS
ncbi:MAG: urea transporter [Bradymonadia bacterium]